MQSMKTALQADPAAAQLVAAECVVEAETKDHMNWELIGEVAKKLTGDEAKALKEAHGEVEEQEDEHLYHTMGWARELWLESLGLPGGAPAARRSRSTSKSAIGADRARAGPDGDALIAAHDTDQGARDAEALVRAGARVLRRLLHAGGEVGPGTTGRS